MPSSREGGEDERQWPQGQAAVYPSDSEEGELTEDPRESARVSGPLAGGPSHLPQPGKSALHPNAISMPVLSEVSGNRAGTDVGVRIVGYGTR